MPRKKANHWLTTAQRERLIGEYIETQEDLDEDTEGTAERLRKLDNSKLIEECVAFMPECMEDLA